MAGPWLRYRGHLDHISNNCFIGAVNAFNEKSNSILNPFTDVYAPVPEVQRHYQQSGIGTLVVGDENYGEGSSREHAAMEPRHLGVRVILVKSFARIHETNLKKQGMLAITFVQKSDYDLIQEKDIFDLIDLTQFLPGKPITISVKHSDGFEDQILCNHSYNDTQINWFKAGSALNLLAKINHNSVDL
jgi:aconitate hydratase